MDPRQLKLAKVFHDSKNERITSLDFDAAGEYCVVGCPAGESITLYEALDGTHRKTVFSKKYGVGTVVRFTHRANNVLYTSGRSQGSLPDDHAIRYLSLHDNAYLRYFRGHLAPVRTLEMCPRDDSFVSGAENDTVRFWDLRSANCHGVLAVNGMPLVAWDPQGLVLALALESKYVRLYDTKNYERGPFAAFEVVDPQRGGLAWCSLAFSPDGKELLIGTKGGGVIYLLDSFDGYVRQVLTSPQSPSSQQLDLQPCYSTDSRHIFCGAPDGKINVWSREDGRVVTQLEGHASYPLVVKCNPRYAMLASACTNLVPRPSWLSLLFIMWHLGLLAP